MNIVGKKKIVVLGMISRWPVAGVAWVTVHYLLGLERLGYETYYVEAHGQAPAMLMEHPDDDGAACAAAYIAGIMERFGLGKRWGYHALYDNSRCRGMSAAELTELYRSAALLINLHGATEPLPEHSATGRLVYMGTDPGQVEIRLHEGDQKTVERLAPHTAFFTWGLNQNEPDCKLPAPRQFRFCPLPPPVVLDLWEDGNDIGPPPTRIKDNGFAPAFFTTIGSWRQCGRDVCFQGQPYRWSKHHEFLKFLDLPRRSETTFELALNRCTDEDRRLLREHGWNVRDALSFSGDMDSYRDYIRCSGAEFTVAKDQNVRLKTGWFSERSVQYLAAGRPVITQDTGFSNILPTGEGLFGFLTMEDILAAVNEIKSDFARHSGAARALARDYFAADVVLKRMLAEVGV